MSKATHESTSTSLPTQTMTPDALSALADRFRRYAGTIRNPGLVTDLRAGAQVINGLVHLYVDVHSGKQHDVVQAVRDLVGGKAAVPINLALPRAEGTALEQCFKRIGYEDVVKFAATAVTYDGLAESEVTWSSVLMLQRALADTGYVPR